VVVLGETLLSFAWVALMAIVLRVCRDENPQDRNEPRVGGGHSPKAGDVRRHAGPIWAGACLAAAFMVA
jgi:hypothetical protein